MTERIPLPSFELATGVAEAYHEDGVRAELSYDPETSEWFVDLNEEDYKLYQQNLARNRSTVLKNFTRTWDGVNLQSMCTVPPTDQEETLFLYLIDNDCKTTHGFKITRSIDPLISRKQAFMLYGSTCETCKRKMSTLLIWQKQKMTKEE